VINVILDNGYKGCSIKNSMKMPIRRESFTAITGVALLTTELVAACGGTATSGVDHKGSSPAAVTAKPNRHTFARTEHTPAVSVTKPNKSASKPGVSSLPCLNKVTYASKLLCLAQDIDGLYASAPSSETSGNITGTPLEFLQVEIRPGVIIQLVTDPKRNTIDETESDASGLEIEINGKLSGSNIETDCLNGSSNNPVQHQENITLGGAELTQVTGPTAAAIVKVQLATASLLVAMVEHEAPYQSPASLQSVPGCSN
jgi:hypothetical protein